MVHNDLGEPHKHGLYFYTQISFLRFIHRDGLVMNNYEI